MINAAEEEIQNFLNLIKESHIKKGSLLLKLKAQMSATEFNAKLTELGIDELSARMYMRDAENPDDISMTPVIELGIKEIEKFFNQSVSEEQ
jgi:hypothetical protein